MSARVRPRSFYIHEGFDDGKKTAGHEQGWTQLLKLLDKASGAFAS